IDKGYNFFMWDMMADRLNNSSKHYPADAADSGWLTTTDTKRFNIPVWHAYEDALRLAKDNKVYVMPFTGMMWQGAQYNFTDFKIFLRYFVARFAPFYNFMGWSPTWETTDIWSAGETNQIMQYVYDIDPWKRLLTVHDCSNSRYQGWLSFSMRQQAGRDLFTGNSRRVGAVQGDCDGVGGIGAPFVNLPIIGSEDLWETRPDQAQIYDPTGWIMPRDADETRRAAWGIMMAGVMPLYSEWHAWAPLPGGNGQGEPQVRRMFDFFYSKTQYRQYEQLNSLVSRDARQVCSGIPGEEYLVYDEGGGSITINLAEAPSSSTFSVLWYDPRSGAKQSGADINGGATRTLTSPFSGDSVLLLSW
ncbi:MAG: putative collagen-binding domain-containing protein, partial [Candidatus Binatia bacterium]